MGDDNDAILAARRRLLDAIYAIHAGNNMIRVDMALVTEVEVAWNAYDAAVRADERALAAPDREGA